VRPDPTQNEALPRELAERRFSRLYEEHERQILRYALRRCNEPEDAADIVAETFLVAWRRLGDVPLGAGARLWLYATARRVLANHRRGVGRRTRLADRLREELRRQVPSQPASGGNGVVAALAEMGDADRELLMLIGMEELTPREAARVLGIGTVTARTRLHRARRRLRAQLAKGTTKGSAGMEMEVGGTDERQGI
jgi:RNA polymerase sigma-70 factor (ECF subfamily)